MWSNDKRFPMSRSTNVGMLAKFKIVGIHICNRLKIHVNRGMLTRESVSGLTKVELSRMLIVD